MRGVVSRCALCAAEALSGQIEKYLRMRA